MHISRELGELNAPSYFAIATTYRKLGAFKKEEELLDTALALVTRERNRALQKKIWKAKAENFAGQRKFEMAYSTLDSAFSYYEKEIDSSIIVQAKELETQYGLLEKQNQIKSLALANEVSQGTRERQGAAVVTGILITTVVLLRLWRRRQLKMKIREEG